MMCGTRTTAVKLKKRNVSGYIPTVLQGDRVTHSVWQHTRTHAQDHFSSPVEEGGEDANAKHAEWQDVEDVGQEHLPLAVEAIFALLVADGSQCRD